MSSTIQNDALRAHPRYVAAPPIEGSFGDVDIALLNISVAGALIRHREPIGELKERALRFSGVGLSSIATLHAEIIWTRSAMPGSGTEYESGLHFTQWIEVAQGVIDRLIDRKAIHLDTSRPLSRHPGSER